MINTVYETYVETGLDWLPKIPKGWELISLRRGIDFLTDFEANGSFADVKKNVELDTDEKYAWYLRATDLQNNRHGISDDVRTCNKKAYDYLTKTKLYGNEFLVAKRGEIGKIYIVPELSCKATLAPNLYLIRLNEKLNTKFTYYWYSSSYGKPELFLADKSTTIGALYKDDVRACKILLPSLFEQEKVVNFLDYETAKIDTLIEKQQTLIQLLKEKRQAVISHAVTKGLNPDVPMKDSGVEWLGEVPEHWTVSFVKYIVLGEKDSMVDGPFGSSVNTSEDYVDDGIPVIRTVNITNNGFSSDNLKFMRQQKFDQLKRHSVKPGDVLFSKVGTIGNACLLPSDIPEAILSTTGSCKISVDQNKIEGEYLVLMFHLMNQTLMEMANSNVQPFLNMSNIKNLKISLPSIEEQKNILTYLEEKLEGIDDLIAKSLSFDKLIRERRTALISAAVTGKIDVRGWRASE